MIYRFEKVLSTQYYLEFDSDSFEEALEEARNTDIEEWEKDDDSVMTGLSYKCGKDEDELFDTDWKDIDENDWYK